MGIFDFLAAKDITEKYGKGVGYNYIKEQLRQLQQDNYNEAASYIEEYKTKYIKIIIDLYNEKKELFDKDFNDKFINIITTFSTSTIENIDSVQLILDMIVNDMLLTITIKDTISQIKTSIEENSKNEKIQKHKEEILSKIEEIDNTKDLQQSKQKLIEFTDIATTLGINIENKEELLNNLNLKL